MEGIGLAGDQTTLGRIKRQSPGGGDEFLPTRGCMSTLQPSFGRSARHDFPPRYFHPARLMTALAPDTDSPDTDSPDTDSPDTDSFDLSRLGGLMSDDQYWPVQPRRVEETGLSPQFIESLLLKTIHQAGTISGRNAAKSMGLPFRILEEYFEALRSRKFLTHVRPAAFNDYYYSLTESGGTRAKDAFARCAYVGPAPITLDDYCLGVEVQASGVTPITRADLAASLRRLAYQDGLLDELGPAINSNTGMFLFGPPGNGKTTIARALTACMGQEIWIPHAILDDGNLIKVKDDSLHHASPGEHLGEEDADIDPGLMGGGEWDRRWIRIRRPSVVVGGELTLDNLEIRHDRQSNVCEAALQIKSNGGCLLIDDFGRQRVRPEELLNRWIIPLENRCDYLTLPSGKKIQVPFEQLIIFSTNLDPGELVDEAFLRRVPYKIFVSDPTPKEYVQIVETVASDLGFPPTPQLADYLLAFYKRTGRAMRRCHPRDLLQQVAANCRYRDIPPRVEPALIDQACRSYFSHL